MSHSAEADRYPDERLLNNRVMKRVVGLSLQDLVHIPPHPARTILPERKGPTVNRALKPGRRVQNSSSDGRLQCLESADKDFTLTHRPIRSLPKDQLSLPPLPGQTITNQINPFDEFPPRPALSSPQTGQNNPPTWTESGSSRIKQVKSRQATSTGHKSQRFSLDLESQDLCSDSEAEHTSSDSHVRQQHHEWPQARGDANHSSFHSHSRPAQGLEEQNWYVGAFSRVDAEHALHLVNQEGAFLVRDCSKNTTHEPFVLALFYDKRVFNIQIRFSEATNKFTLGTGLRTSERFDSVTDIIKFHSIFPILLIDGRKSLPATDQRRHCVLMYPITKQDMTNLLN